MAILAQSLMAIGTLATRLPTMCTIPECYLTSYYLCDFNGLVVARVGHPAAVEVLPGGRTLRKHRRSSSGGRPGGHRLVPVLPHLLPGRVALHAHCWKECRGLALI